MSPAQTAAGHQGLAISQRIGLGAGVVMAAGCVYTGISGGLRDIATAETIGQTVQSWAQLGYGALAATLIALRLGLRRRVNAVSWLWVGVLAVAAGVAPVAWGDTSIPIGIFSGLVAAGIAYGIDRLLAVGAPAPTPVRSVPPGVR